jgi:hypothetical protein
MRPDYVELNRTFLDFDEKNDVEGAALKSYMAGLFGELTWDKLLQSQYVVILGEAGSGKTWELEAQAEKQRAQGRHSFFVRIDALATQSFDAALNAKDAKSFFKWRANNQEAAFFLDSVDEAKLQRPQALQDALNTFEKALGSTALKRARLIITCRVSEWRGNADLYELRGRFGIPQGQQAKERPHTEEKESPPILRIVQLAPLDRQRVSILASHLHINDVDIFIEAIDSKDAWDFAGRPKDVENLAAYWKQYQRLGSLSELIEFDVRHKLRETPARAQLNPLTDHQASDGARSMAAAVLFCKSFTFIIPDEPADPQLVASSITPQDVLPDWQAVQVQALLSRAIFDEATYGKVRFHHRTEAEFLAAQWVAKCKEQACPEREIHRLLFANSHGREVVIPSRAPIAAWLADGDEQWRQRIRNQVVRINPEVLINYGDPQSLPLDRRRALLKGIINRYLGRSRIRIDINAAQLKRLAHEDLSPEINEYLRNPAIPADIREFFLQLVQHGSLTACVDAALSILANQHEEDDLRQQAVFVVNRVGTQEQLRMMSEVAAGYRKLSSETCGFLCVALYPKVIDANGLIELIEKIDEPQNAENHLQYMLKEHLSKVAPDSDLTGLLVKLMILIGQEPHSHDDGKKTPISAQYSWLGDSLFEVVRRLLMRPELGEETSQNIVHALFLLQYFREIDYGQKKYDLKAELIKHPMIRQKYVWRRVADLRTQNTGLQIEFLEIFDYYSIFELNAADQSWLISDVMARESHADKEIALLLSIGLWNSTGHPRRIRSDLRQATRENKNLQKIFKQQVSRKYIISPTNFYNRFKYSHWWSIKRRIGRFRERWNAFSRNWWLWKNAKKIQAGEAVRALHYLASYRPEGASHGEYGDGRWQDLISQFGTRVALAAREGCKKFWRTFTPILPHERPDLNRRDGRIVIGLVGIKTAIEDGLDIPALNNNESVIATRYALNELNRFPDWFIPLVSNHPQEVLSILSQCINAEWGTSAEQQHSPDTLRKLRYDHESVRSLIAPRLLELLLEGDPPHRDVLSQTLDILLKSSHIQSQHISNLAPQRIQRYQVEDGQFFVWLVAWLHTDGMRAIDFIDQFLQSHPDQSTSFMEMLGSIFNSHSSRDFPANDSPSYQDVACLVRLIPLFYRYIRREDDIRRKGVFTPTARDDAQSYRSALLEMLYQSSSKEAFNALHKLLDNPYMASIRDWLLQLLDKRTEIDAEGPAWKAQDIALFMHDYEIAPRSSDALFQMSLDRLDDIRISVESTDFSKRKYFRESDTENAFQVWLAAELKATSRKKYEVIREEEVDKKKKPDIRMHIPGLQPVTIEIKWAHSCSYSELETALVDQLIGQYMKVNSSRHGVLVIGNLVKHTWRPKPGIQLDFAGLITALKAKAGTELPQRNNIDGLEIVGIDFLA